MVILKSTMITLVKTTSQWKLIIILGSNQTTPGNGSNQCKIIILGSNQTLPGNGSNLGKIIILVFVLIIKCLHMIFKNISYKYNVILRAVNIIQIINIIYLLN